jgi:tetratricopeptide (TPR) repeat protein
MRIPGFALLLLAACEAPEKGAPSLPIYYDTPNVKRKVTTASPDAQLWFDRGLALTFGFNHEEAVACFEKAAAADPGCAMAHWGKANALGPNYNDPAPDEARSRAAREAADRAVAALDGETAAEKALVNALRARYASTNPEDRARLDKDYAARMRKVYAAFPDDADVCALTGEALMQVIPWALWDHAGKPAPETAEIRRVLEAGLARWPNHPALCHLYIHAMEAGPEVGKAIPAAQTLENLTPGLGHLVHMPSHAYVWTGRYEDVIRTNVQACKVDDVFARERGKNNLYTAYRIHNYHFVAYGAMWDGQRELALKYARAIPGQIPPELMAAIPDLFDIFVATPYHVMVRFGLWDEMIAEPEPAKELLATRAVWRYARGVAFASLGRVAEAEAEQELFRKAQAAVPASRILFNNPVSEILKVAEKVLDGEIEYRKGDYDAAFARLREAVELDYRLNYDEPWGWMEPAEHALGALLTEQKRFEEALAVYQKNLKRYPNNGWALHGYAECLRGLGRDADAAEAQARFDAAWARSDTKIPGSCFCKTGQVRAPG